MTHAGERVRGFAAATAVVLVCLCAAPAPAQEAAADLPDGLARGPREGVFVWEKDGAEMVWVGAGAFPRGSATGEADEAPVAQVEVGGFYVDRTEVTNLQYRRFLSWWDGATVREREAVRHRDAPADLDPRPAFWPREGKAGADAGAGTEEAVREEESYHGDAYPVVGVSWYAAFAYARWAGKDLPTEVEWEKAASWDAASSSKRPWPWGTQAPDFTRGNFDGSVGRPVQPGRYPSGAAACGAVDLAGNVWEWCLDFYHPGFYATEQGRAKDPVDIFPSATSVVRGGAYSSRATEVRPTYRDRADPRKTYRDVGFRCVLRSETP